MRNSPGNKRLVLPILFIIVLSLPGLISCASPIGGVAIDWVDFIHFGGITYLAGSTKPGRSITKNDLGPVFAIVQFKLEGNVQDPGYKMKDGDAAFLDAGAKVYSMKGYSPTFRLIAQKNNALTLYEADTNPHARKGGDLIDIGGKVRSISIISDQDGVTELGAMKDPRQVAMLVSMILAALVDQNHQPGNQRYFLAFYLLDGTTVTRAYWLDTGELERGVLLPRAFGLAIRAALPK